MVKAQNIRKGKSMHKIVSIILSSVMVLGSVLPSYGEGLAGLRRERARAGVYEVSDNTRMGKGIELAVLRGRQVQAGAQGKGLLKEVEGLYGYKGFSAQYRKAVDKAYEEGMEKLLSSLKEVPALKGPRLYGKVLPGQYRETVEGAHEEEIGKEMPAAALSEGEVLARRNALTELYQELMKEENIRLEYEKVKVDGDRGIYGEPEQIKELGKRIMEYGKGSGADKVVVKDLVVKGLSGFAAAGLIEEEVREWGAAFLVEDIARRKGVCGGVGFIEGLSGKKVALRREGCEEVLEEVAALAVLGKAEDGAVVLDLMKEGYKGVEGAGVILVGGTALYEMGALDSLTGAIYNAGEALADVGVFLGDYSVVSVHDWVEGVKEFSEDGSWGMKDEGGW